VNRQDIITGIRKVWEFSRALGVSGVFSSPTPLSPSEEFVEIATNTEASYETLYLCGLRNSDYNVQLVDYSFFQFGITREDHVRFAYYPNPFLGSSAQAIAEVNELSEYVEEGLVTIEEFLHRIAEIRKSQHPPLGGSPIGPCRRHRWNA
jgi:hypothetical protein